jgi:tRNA A-37 threonylcarbamoyl transferase component Bud32/tetratricopeptide (TPR) repeat protein
MKNDPSIKPSMQGNNSDPSPTLDSPPDTHRVDPTTVLNKPSDQSSNPGEETQGTIEFASDRGSFDVDETIVREEPRAKGLEDHIETLVQDRGGKGKSGPSGGVVGDYQILGELGRGGMGVVYKARHRKLERIVALKMILNGKHSGDSALKRFVSEARAVAHLQHPGIVQIFDIGEHNGLPYFSLEFVEGRDLHKDLNGMPRDAKSSAEMVEQLALTMQYAHDNKILHRDLKPANVLLDSSGKPKITDFGLAKQVDTDSSLATNDGTILGSPSYMPPEQARGDISSMSPRSDLYSLGAILYQMLTARPPFITDRPLDTILQVMNNEPVPPRQLQPGIPVDLETICMKALQKDQSVRYSSCKELAEDLRRFIDGKPILARPISRMERVVRWCKRNPTVAIPSVAAGFFFVATTFISTWAWQESAANAVIIADERDNVKEERDNAKKEKEEAYRQRVLADEAKLQAEKNQKLAESQAMLAVKNMQMIVTDIDERLAQQPGMNDTRIALLEFLDVRWNELDLSLAGGIQGQAIPTQMAVRDKLASAFVNLGKLDKANAQFEKLYEQAQQRVLAKDRNDASRFNLALVCAKWAPVRGLVTKDPKVEQALMTEARELYRDIQKSPRPEPKSPNQGVIANSFQGLLLQAANAALSKGNVNLAESEYQELVSAAKDSLKAIQDNGPWLEEVKEETKQLLVRAANQNLQIGQSGVARAIAWQGRIDEAIPLFETSVQKNREMVVALPPTASPAERTDVNVQLAKHLANLGRYCLRFGKFGQAAKAYAEARDRLKEAYETDINVVSIKRDYGSTLFYTGIALEGAGFANDALVHYERARVLRSELVAASPDNSNKVDLMLTEARLGNVEATKILIDDLSKNSAKNPDLWLDIARSLSQLFFRSKEESRIAFRDSAIQALERCVSDGMMHPFPIDKEPDLIPIREEEQFKAIVRQLAKT